LPEASAGEADSIIPFLRIALESRTRRLAIWKLMKSGASESVSELAHELHLSMSQVIGVMRGSGEQYKIQYSLMQLKLVTETQSKGSAGRVQKTYRFTCKNQVLLSYIEKTLEGYRAGGEA
jgi:predicted transcriptional regulator with HTH domain